MAASNFETVVCTRCAGTGHYSYCRDYGTRCFKCHGKKETLTKRGQAAHNYFFDSLNLPACKVQVGMLVQCEDWCKGTRWFETVVEIHTVSSGLVFTTRDKNGQHTDRQHDSKDAVRIGHSLESKQAKLQKALDYQATLTKAGTPRKVRARA